VTILVCLTVAASAWAQAEEALAGETAAEPSRDMALGARVGMQLGVGRVTPGGLRVAGVFLHRLDADWWFDGEAAFSFGGGGMECRPSATGDLECDHGLVEGAGAQGIAGVRWSLGRAPSGFEPYLRGGVGLAYASFGDDEISGLAILGQLAAGGRFRIADRIAVGAESAVFFGPGFYSDDLGTVGYGGLIVQGGVEIDL
jgi:hypothetical protein